MTETTTLNDLGSNAGLGAERTIKHHYWRNLFSLHKLRGNWITWSFGKCWWVRICRVILRAEYASPKWPNAGIHRAAEGRPVE